MVDKHKLDCLVADAHHAVYSTEKEPIFAPSYPADCVPRVRDDTKNAHELAEEFKSELLNALGLADHPLAARIKVVFGRSLTASMLRQLFAVDVCRVLARVLNANDDEDRAQLYEAVSEGHEDIVRDLLEAGCDPNGSCGGRSPLAQAISHNHNIVAACLLGHGANIAAAVSDGLTALHIAVLIGNHEGLRLLLAHGSDPNVVIVNGLTPLHLAQWTDQPDLTELLLVNGADMTLRRSDGLTALDLAETAGHVRAAAILREFAGRQ